MSRADTSLSASIAAPSQSGVRSMQTSHRTTLMLRAKVVVVGDACVGKSSVVQMFKSGGHDYPKNYIMTIGVDFGVKQVKVPETDSVVELFLFDCPGQGVFNKLEQGAAYYENAAFVCVVFDVSNRDSFESCGRWLQGVRAALPSTSAPLPGVVIANKSDLREGGINARAVVETKASTLFEGQLFALQNGLDYFETSAAGAKDIDAPFHHMASRFHETYEKTIEGAEGEGGLP
ncbi:unnamed protein product [Ectocarpus sp. 13 AM-2016]